MKKLLFLCLFFIVWLFSPRGTSAQSICPGGATVKLEPDQILTTTQGARAIVTTSQGCFVTNNVNYRSMVWFENQSIDSGKAGTVKLQDARTAIVEWDTIGNSARPGTWHFTLWQGDPGRSINDTRRQDTAIVWQYNFQITFPGGNPSISPKQPAYQVGSSAIFVIKNAQTGQDYTFWWDGEKIITNRNPTMTAPASEFEYTMPVESAPGTKKLCMKVGGIGAGGIGQLDCHFSTSVGFTSGPPPVSGIAPGGTITPIAPIRLNEGCETNEIRTAIGCIPYGDANSFVGWFLKWAIGIAGGIAFLMIIFSGFQIMTSSNNPQQLQTGRELLTAAVSGLILIIFSAFLLKLIGVDILGIPGLGQ